MKKLEQEQKEELTGELEFKDSIKSMESEYTQLRNELKSMKKKVAEAKSNQLVRHNLAIDNAQWVRSMRTMIWETRLAQAHPDEDGDFMPYSARTENKGSKELEQELDKANQKMAQEEKWIAE